MELLVNATQMDNMKSNIELWTEFVKGDLALETLLKQIVK